MKYLKLPTQKRLNELFTYNKNTGDLIRKTTIRKNSQKNDVISSQDAKGYLQVRVDGTRYKAHRLIYKMFYGVEDRYKQIDHINGIKTDNRISNLRLVDQSVNQKNCILRKDNSSGCAGVSAIENNKWIAYVHSEHINYYLGRFTTKEAAIKARQEKQKMLNFSKRHGKK